MKAPTGQGDYSLAAKYGPDCTGIPAQNIYLKLRIALDQPVYIMTDFQRPFWLMLCIIHLDACVKVPTDQDDSALGVFHGVSQVTEIIFRINDYGCPVRIFNGPAITGNIKYAGRVCHCHPLFGNRRSEEHTSELQSRPHLV